jgi:hypothetical protein
MVNTVRVITSWMIFSSKRLNGPPDSLNPMRLAGTWKQYSKKANPHDSRITAISGQFLDIPDVCNFRCPYHANVMNTFEIISITIVIIPDFI